MRRLVAILAPLIACAGPPSPSDAPSTRQIAEEAPFTADRVVSLPARRADAEAPPVRRVSIDSAIVAPSTSDIAEDGNGGSTVVSEATEIRVVGAAATASTASAPQLHIGDLTFSRFQIDGDDIVFVIADTEAFADAEYATLEHGANRYEIVLGGEVQ